LLTVFVDLDLLVTVTLTIYIVPTTSFPVEIGMSAVDDSIDLFSITVLSDSFLVLMSILTPNDGIFDEILTVNAKFSALAIAFPNPGSGSIEKARFSSVGGGGGGGGGVGVSFFEQARREKKIAIKKIPRFILYIMAISYKIKKIIDFKWNKFLLYSIINFLRWALHSKVNPIWIDLHENHSSAQISAGT
jgi:hypothetical protein